MNHPKKKTENSDLKHISEEREKEVERVFQNFGMPHKENLPDCSEGYHTPFKQLSVLKNEEIIVSNSG